MTSCPHSYIEATLDRWHECHWHIHQMELHYHEPSLFRYSLNSFLRAINEVPQILKMETQNQTSVREKLARFQAELAADALFDTLKKKRNFVVHQSMLDLRSKGSVGTMEGHHVKLSFPFPVFPFEKSEEAYERYKAACRTDSFLRELTGCDEDSIPCVWRIWMIPDFPDRDLLDVAVDAWSAVGSGLSTAVEAFGGTPLETQLTCRHAFEKVRVKQFSQDEFFQSVYGIDLAQAVEEAKQEARSKSQGRKSHP